MLLDTGCSSCSEFTVIAEGSRSSQRHENCGDIHNKANVLPVNLKKCELPISAYACNSHRQRPLLPSSIKDWWECRIFNGVLLPDYILAHSLCNRFKDGRHNDTFETEKNLKGSKSSIAKDSMVWLPSTPCCLLQTWVVPVCFSCRTATITSTLPFFFFFFSSHLVPLLSLF